LCDYYSFIPPCKSSLVARTERNYKNDLFAMLQQPLVRTEECTDVYICIVYGLLLELVLDYVRIRM